MANISARHMLRFGLVLTILALATLTVRIALPVVSGQAPRTRAYTAVLVETLTGANGQQRVVALRTVAARSDGSTAEAWGAEGKNRARTIYYATGARIRVNDGLRLKTSYRFPPDAHSQPKPDQNCLQRDADTVLGEEQVAGYRAVKLQSGEVTAWHALDYGCALFRQHVDSGEKGRSETELVLFVPGEPSGMLFNVPNEFREVPPSLLRGPRTDCGPRCQEQNARDDKHYNEHRLQ